MLPILNYPGIIAHKYESTKVKFISRKDAKLAKQVNS